MTLKLAVFICLIVLVLALFVIHAISTRPFNSSEKMLYGVVLFFAGALFGGLYSMGDPDAIGISDKEIYILRTVPVSASHHKYYVLLEETKQSLNARDPQPTGKIRAYGVLVAPNVLQVPLGFVVLSKDNRLVMWPHTESLIPEKETAR